MWTLHSRAYQFPKDLVSVPETNPSWARYVPWERDIKLDCPAPFIHPALVFVWLPGLSGCSGQQGESLGLPAPFFSICLSVLLYGSCQGLQRWSGINFFLCFAHREGQEISFCTSMFWRGVSHPSVYAYIHAYAVQVHPLCLFLCLMTSSDASSLCRHGRGHESMSKLWPLNCKVFGNSCGGTVLEEHKSTGMNHQPDELARHDILTA